jgi:beta propeller repeat protein
MKRFLFSIVGGIGIVLLLIFGYLAYNEYLAQWQHFSKFSLVLTPSSTNWQQNLTPVPSRILSPSPNDQSQPAVDGSRVVWAEKIGVHRQIVLLDMNDDSRHQLTSDNLDHVSPLIRGDLVIWSQGESGDPKEVAGINLATDQSLILPHERVSGPRIGDGGLVWAGEVTDTDSFARPIIWFNLETQTSQAIAYYRLAGWPDASGNIVVWEDWRNQNAGSDNANIYGYDLLSRQEFPIAVAKGDQESPSISGSTVVWRDNRNTGSLNFCDIYGYDLQSKREFTIARDRCSVMPEVSGNFVVWGDQDEIYTFDLQRQIISTIASAANNQSNNEPTVSGIVIVWTQWDGSYPNVHSQIMVGQISTQP